MGVCVNCLLEKRDKNRTFAKTGGRKKATSKEKKRGKNVNCSPPLSQHVTQELGKKGGNKESKDYDEDGAKCGCVP